MGEESDLQQDAEGGRGGGGEALLSFRRMALSFIILVASLYILKLILKAKFLKN